MIDNIQDILEKITLFDYSYIILTILLMIRGAFKGFVLSILSAAKWVLAYVLTIFIFSQSQTLCRKYFRQRICVRYNFGN